jgi:acetylornithine deacetylase
MNNQETHLYDESLMLLKELISIPSFSREEQGTAGAIARFFALKSMEHSWVGNNIYALNRHYDPAKPTLLLNSHHDTVKPNKSYTLDPFSPIEKEGSLALAAMMREGRWFPSLPASFISITCRTWPITSPSQQPPKRKFQDLTE